jgi:hypothetical protein
MIGVIVNGTSYTFDNPTDGYVTAADGFGMPPLDRFSQRGAQQHGASDLGYRLNARRVSLVITLPVDTEREFYAARERLLQLFHPDNAITLKVTDGVSMDRRLDVVFDAVMDMPLDHDWHAKNVIVTLRTSGLPAWYDATARSIAFDAGGGAGSFSVPMPIPHSVGSTTVNMNAVLDYEGTWEEYPRIKIMGPITDCVITNTETQEELDFTGFSLTAGHFIEIDTRYGLKTVLYDGITNYMDKLTAASDLSMFHLVPVKAGETVHENSFSVTGTNATDATKIEIFWNNRYIGI